MSKSAVQVLSEAKGLLDANGVIRGLLGGNRLSDGRVIATNVFSKDTNCFCSIGAIARTLGPDAFQAQCIPASVGDGSEDGLENFYRSVAAVPGLEEALWESIPGWVAATDLTLQRRKGTDAEGEFVFYVNDYLMLHDQEEEILAWFDRAIEYAKAQEESAGGTMIDTEVVLVPVEANPPASVHEALVDAQMAIMTAQEMMG